MLKSKATWKFTETTDQEETMIDTLLQQRGINTLEERNQFLHPSLQDITSASNLNGVEKAKARIEKAIEADESIMIYGDYDADGITSTALLMQVFIELGANCDFYIPNRFSEGYGLNKQAIDHCHQAGVSLIITVDNGIANVAEVAYLNSLGMDVIITDHHEAQTELPDAHVIIHPKLSNQYPFKELAGVGVAFQLAHYLLDEMPTHLLELVAIGTIADLVPLQEDNRILAYYGLKQINDTTNIGLSALKKVCQMDSSKIVTEKDIGFMIAPRLNAVGRLSNATLAVQLLLTVDPMEAEEIAAKIELLNKERQDIVKQIVKEAETRVDPDDGIIMLYDENWHEGVLGIAASRLVRKFDRPVIMLTHKKATGELKGSGRSIPAFHLFENGMQIRHLFKAFGGHAQAAGMTFSVENFAEIKAWFNETIANELTEDDFSQVITGIQRVPLEEMTESLVEQVNMMRPFGMGNEEPVFYFKGIPSGRRQIGQNGNHLKLQFKEKTHQVDVIGFSFGHTAYFISSEVEVAVVGKLEINEWNGNRTVQMLLEDIAVDEWQLFDYRARQQERHITPYIKHFKKQIVLGHNRTHLEKIVPSNAVTVMTYDQEPMDFDYTDILYICDLPAQLDTLENIIQKINPQNIHVSYGITEDAFLQHLPNRDDFKWVYGFLMKHEPIRLQVDLAQMMQLKGWTKEKIIFILKVFLDLQFVYVKDDVIYLQPNVTKTPLEQSKTYQSRLMQSDIEKILYYSTYASLKEWFGECLHHREEVTYGL
jgi:single-stranded-DNA-specific exonuclease